MNHSKTARTFEIAWNLPAGVEADRPNAKLSLAAGAEGRARVRLKASRAGLFVVTADVGFAGFRFREWTEAMLKIE